MCFDCVSNDHFLLLYDEGMPQSASQVRHDTLNTDDKVNSTVKNIRQECQEREKRQESHYMDSAMVTRVE